MHGTVTAVDDEVATLEIAPDVHVRYARPAIARIVTRRETVEADEVVETTDVKD
jgi:preprotein translocase subunit YajC